MGAILVTILRTLGVTAAGWAVSDWFNERQASKQAQTEFSTGKLFRVMWVKWLVIGLVSALVAVLFYIITKRLLKIKES